MLDSGPDAMLELNAPDIQPEDLAAVARVLEGKRLLAGPEIARFEAAVAEAVGANHAVAVSSGTAALVLALQAAGVGPGDEVLVPAFTFLATAHAVVLVGATPVLVDVDPRTWNLDPGEAARAITSRTTAILPVDQFGLPVEVEPLLMLRRRDGLALTLIEDAACAVGAARHGRPVGAGPGTACLSFHPRKIITTGEGGMVLTDEAGLADRIRQLRTLGRDGSGRFVEVGPNLRMTELGAALGRSQLGRLPALVERRRALATRYRSRLHGHPRLRLQAEPPGLRHCYQTFALCLGPELDRAMVIASLARDRVQAGVATYGVHRELPYRSDERIAAQPLPVADELAARGLALPLHPGMTESEVDRVCAALERALEARP
ncbi:MAG: DegT/DnrJ/EryC1/StrS family aminotransferase [Deltaproteobacteria bacterium]|nr:DegT/DnrJ/EryC1/StrS family aminotransferase [Deltaproteobacteria bacterium]